MTKIALVGASALVLGLFVAGASAEPYQPTTVYGYPSPQFDYPAATGYGYPANWDYHSAPPYPYYAGPGVGRAAAVESHAPYQGWGPGSMLLQQFHEGRR